MKAIVLSLLSLAITVQAHAQCVSLDVSEVPPKPEDLNNPTWQSEWKVCASDADCVVIEGSCDSPVGVNKKYKGDAEAWSSNRNSVIDCAVLKPDRSLPKARCENKCCYPTGS